MRKLRMWCFLLIAISLCGFGAAPAQPGQAKKDSPGKLAEQLYNGKPLNFWIELAQSEDPLDVEEAIAVLSDVGPSASAALPAITKALKSESAPIRVKAAVAVWKIGRRGKEAVPVLVEVLQDPTNNSRMQAIVMVATIGPDAVAAAPMLVAALADRNTLLRQRAAVTLEQLGAEAAAFVVEGLSHSDPTVRRYSATILGRLPPAAAQAAKPKLTAALKDKDAQVRLNATQALWRLEHHADTVAGELVNLVANSDNAIHKSAANLLCTLKPRPKQAAPCFTGLLRDTNAWLRVTSAEALWDLHHDPKEVLPVVVGILKDPKLGDERLRRCAAGPARTGRQGNLATDHERGEIHASSQELAAASRHDSGCGQRCHVWGIGALG